MANARLLFERPSQGENAQLGIGIRRQAVDGRSGSEARAQESGLGAGFGTANCRFTIADCRVLAAEGWS